MITAREKLWRNEITSLNDQNIEDRKAYDIF